MSDIAHTLVQAPSFSSLTKPVSWFAVQTYPRHEKRAACQLTQMGVENYLPLLAQLHRWSDRYKHVELPLFPCYMFVRIAPCPEQHVRVLQVSGIIALVGASRQGVPIPDSQIEDIRMLLRNKIPLDPHPFLKVGQRVRICGGCLDGIEGILVRRDGRRRMVISVDNLERSLSLCIEGLDVEAI